MSDSRFLTLLEDPFISGHALLRNYNSCNALSKDHNIDNPLTKPKQSLCKLVEKG